jgi:hypothetical protein
VRLRPIIRSCAVEHHRCHGEAMIRKENNPEYVNRIANDPAVRPFLDFRTDKTEPLDFTPALDRPGITGVVWLSDGEEALAAFEITAPRIYQVHFLFGAACRGRKAINAALAMAEWMFGHGADIIWGAVDHAHRAAIMFSRLIGARILPTSDDETTIFELRAA